LGLEKSDSLKPKGPLSDLGEMPGLMGNDEKVPRTITPTKRLLTGFLIKSTLTIRGTTSKEIRVYQNWYVELCNFGCEVYTTTFGGGGRPRFTRSIIFFGAPFLYSGPRWADLGGRRSRGDGNPASHEPRKENAILPVMGPWHSPSHK